MNTNLRRLAAIGVISAAALTASACGSSSDDNSATADDATVTTTGDAAIDDAISTGDVDTALATFDDHASNLPDEAQSAYDQLKADLETAKNATGNDAETAWAKVKDDVAALDDQLSNAAGDVDSSAQDAWTDVKTQFDKITADF